MRLMIRAGARSFAGLGATWSFGTRAAITARELGVKVAGVVLGVSLIAGR